MGCYKCVYLCWLFSYPWFRWIWKDIGWEFKVFVIELFKLLFFQYDQSLLCSLCDSFRLEYWRLCTNCDRLLWVYYCCWIRDLVYNYGNLCSFSLNLYRFFSLNLYRLLFIFYKLVQILFVFSSNLYRYMYRFGGKVW